jgi:hypothetical protein
LAWPKGCTNPQRGGYLEEFTNELFEETLAFGALYFASSPQYQTTKGATAKVVFSLSSMLPLAAQAFYINKFQIHRTARVMPVVVILMIFFGMGNIPV